MGIVSCADDGSVSYRHHAMYTSGRVSNTHANHLWRSAPATVPPHLFSGEPAPPSSSLQGLFYTTSRLPCAALSGAHTPCPLRYLDLRACRLRAMRGIRSLERDSTIVRSFKVVDDDCIGLPRVRSCQKQINLCSLSLCRVLLPHPPTHPYLSC